MGNRESLKDFISQYASELRKLWLDSVLDSYPPETARLLRSQKDQFANPVGYTLRTVIEDVVEGLSTGAEAGELASAIYPLIRIKAVQDFSPSEAVSSVLKLGHAVRELLAAKTPSSGGGGNVLGELDPVIEEMLCLCFDLYVDCRQKLSDIKEEELKRNLYMLLKKADLVESNIRGDG